MIRDSILYLLAGLAARAAGFLMIPFYSSYLTPAEYGTIELIELATQVVSLAIGLNMFGGALIRLYQGSDDPVRQRSVASTSILSALALNAVGISIAVALAGPISAVAFPSAGATHLLRLTLVAMLFGNAADLALCYVRLRNRALFSVIYSVTALVLTLGFNIYFIAFRGQGVMGFVLSKLIVTGAGSILLISLTLRETGFHFKWDAARAMLRFGAPLILANASFFVLHFADRFFLSRFSTLTDVGNYSLAYKFGFLVTFLVADPFGRAFNVRYVSMTRATGWQDQFLSISRLLCASLAGTALAISLFSDELLLFLVTPEYLPAARVIPIIAAAYFLREMGDFFKLMLYVKLNSKLVGAVSLTAAALNLVLNWLWIPSAGMMGAAWATLLTWALYAVTLWLLAQRDLQIHFPWNAYLGLSSAAAAVFLAGLLMPALPAWARFATDALLFAAFLLATWKSPFFAASERRLISEKIAGAHTFLAARFLAPRAS